jgi:hypothetical protein
MKFEPISRHTFRRVIISEIRAHSDVENAVKHDFFERLPVQALEEAGVLVLHRGEKFLAAERVRRGNRFVNQTRTERAESVITRLQIPHRDAGTEMADAAEIHCDAEPRSVPETGFPFVDPHHSRDAVLHSRDQGFANDWDHFFIEQIPIVLRENPLLLAENLTAHREESGEVFRRLRDLEHEIMRAVGREAFEDHGIGDWSETQRR